MKVINLSKALNNINDFWRPRIAAEANGQHFRIAKLKDEFVWHAHADEDEVFIVLKGTLTVKFRDGDKTVREGELLVIPAGVEHCPVADEEVHLLNVTKAETTHTGNVVSDVTVPLSDFERV